MSFDELAGSPRESLNEGSGSTAERRFLIPFNERLTFAQGLIGTRYPNMPQTRVVAVDIQPFTEDLVPSGVIVDPSLATAGYGTQPALVTVKYGPDFTKKQWPAKLPKPQFKAGTELRYRLSSSAQFLLIPSKGAKWESDNELLKNTELNRKLIPIRDIEVDWNFVDDPPLDRLDALVGSVNQTLFLGAEPETLLFENYNVDESFRAAPANPHTNRVTVCFRKRRIEENGNIYGWNHDWREDPPGWDKVIMGGEPRYLLKTFTNTFT